jgi:hypothetical protein
MTENSLIDQSTQQGQRSLPGLLRRILPATLYRLVRSAFMTVFTPTAYAAEHGYYRSALRRSVVGGRGEPAPWLTFPLTAFLDTKSFASRTVLEFGSGQSSLWWSRRADRVLALETDPDWTRRVRAEAPANLVVADVALEHPDQQSFVDEVDRVTDGSRYDVVVVDGGDRVKALHAASRFVTDDGIIITDDLDLFRTDPDWVGALDALRAEGFGSIDFYGLAAGAPFTRRRRCSTMFFRDGAFITR